MYKLIVVNDSHEPLDIHLIFAVLREVTIDRYFLGFPLSVALRNIRMDEINLLVKQELSNNETTLNRNK